MQRNVFFLTIIFGCIFNVLASDISITCPCWSNTLNEAGFSDAFYWDVEEPEQPVAERFHNHPNHELLSGEWGAAIYYDGISTEPNSMWLTNSFLFPNWSTNSTFSPVGLPIRENDPNNPTDGYDKGYSAVENEKVLGIEKEKKL